MDGSNIFGDVIGQKKINDIFDSCQVLSQHESEILNGLEQRLSFLGSQRFVPIKKNNKIKEAVRVAKFAKKE